MRSKGILVIFLGILLGPICYSFSIAEANNLSNERILQVRRRINHLRRRVVKSIQACTASFAYFFFTFFSLYLCSLFSSVRTLFQMKKLCTLV